MNTSKLIHSEPCGIFSIRHSIIFRDPNEINLAFEAYIFRTEKNDFSLHLIIVLRYQEVKTII